MDEKFWAVLVGAPLWLLLLVVIVRSVRDWPGVMERVNEARRDRAKITAEDWRRLREEVQWLSSEVKACRASEAEWRHRAIFAESEVARREAVELGVGQGRQAVQEGLSAHRLSESEKAKKSRKGRRAGEDE